jgi:hypothetical protein
MMMTALQETTKNQEYKSNYLSDEKMEMLKRCKTDIYEATQMTPSIKKLIHELITEENIEKIKCKFINLYRD